MQIQKITQVGNSNGVIIPSSLMKDIDLKRGQRVGIGRLGDTENLVIFTKPQKSQSKRAIASEFQTWLTNMLKEDKELLDELAHR